jgi:hypothetical protein
MIESALEVDTKRSGHMQILSVKSREEGGSNPINHSKSSPFHFSVIAGYIYSRQNHSAREPGLLEL